MGRGVRLTGGHDSAPKSQLRRLYETLQLEIIDVLESLGRLRESPDYELCRIVEQKPGMLDELAEERVKQLDKETGELEEQADHFAEEIKELGGAETTRIYGPRRRVLRHKMRAINDYHFRSSAKCSFW